MERVENRLEAPIPPPQIARPPEQTSRVKKIGIEVLKGLGIVLLGAALGALTLASGGTVWIIVGVSLGATAALVSFVGTKAFIHLKRKKGFPAFSHRTHEPLAADKFTYEKFEKALNKVKSEPAYDTLKGQHPNYSDRRLRRFLWQKVRHHYSEGVALALKDSSEEKSDRKGGKILKNISYTGVFYHQIHEVIDGPKPAPRTFKLRNRTLDQRLQADLGNGVIRLEGKKRSASIFFEVRANGGVFYDGSSKQAGMHVFTDKEEFLQKLDQHVRVALTGKKLFRKQYKSAQVNLY